MPSSNLITPQELLEAKNRGVVLKVFDCSYDLNNSAYGISQYLQEHIPGSIHADLTNALSTTSINAASGGRHPLPAREDFVRWLEKMGMTNDTLAVVYDRNNSSFCVRLWWMLRWVGHENVSVLNGGFQAWKSREYPVESGESPTQPAGTFHLRPPLTKLVDAEDVLSQLNSTRQVLIDARAPERYSGETEPMDAFAGHIPGALNRPFSYNLQEDGTFKSADILRQEFEALLKDKNTDHMVCYCGSGVTATPNILALELAGFGTVSLYGGSWSDWSRRADYPKEKSSKRETD